MRILLATNGFLPEIGGIQAYCYELTKNLTSLGEEVTVLAPGVERDSEFDRKQNFKIVRTKKIAISRLAFFSILKREKIEKVLIAHGSHYVRLASLSNLLFKIPYNIIIYLEEILPPERRKIIQKSFKRADRIITACHFAKEKLAEIGISEEKIVVVHPGVNPVKFNPGLDPFPIMERHHLEDKKVILTISRLDNHKGHDKVLKTLPQVLKKIPNLVYLIVGEGEEKETLRKIVKNLKLEEKVIFTGKVNEKELPLYYTACDVFIMLSSMEGFGIVYSEANACGKPVIGGRIGGTSDAIIDGETGLLIDSFDINQIAEVLIKLLTNPGLARKLGKQGRWRVERELNWERIAQRIRKIIRS